MKKLVSGLLASTFVLQLFTATAVTVHASEQATMETTQITIESPNQSDERIPDTTSRTSETITDASQANPNQSKEKQQESTISSSEEPAIEVNIAESANPNQKMSAPSTPPASPTQPSQTQDTVEKGNPQIATGIQLAEEEGDYTEEDDVEDYAEFLSSSSLDMVEQLFSNQLTDAQLEAYINEQLIKQEEEQESLASLYEVLAEASKEEAVRINQLKDPQALEQALTNLYVKQEEESLNGLSVLLEKATDDELDRLFSAQSSEEIEGITLEIINGTSGTTQLGSVRSLAYPARGIRFPTVKPSTVKHIAKTAARVIPKAIPIAKTASRFGVAGAIGAVGIGGAAAVSYSGAKVIQSAYNYNQAKIVRERKAQAIAKQQKIAKAQAQARAQAQAAAKERERKIKLQVQLQAQLQAAAKAKEKARKAQAEKVELAKKQVIAKQKKLELQYKQAQAKPVSKPIVKPTTVAVKPVVKPTTSVATQPAVKPSTAVTVKPVVKPNIPAIAKPSTTTATKPTQSTVTKPTTQKPVVKPTVPTTVKPVTTAAAKPATPVTTKPAVQVIKPVIKPNNQVSIVTVQNKQLEAVRNQILQSTGTTNKVTSQLAQMVTKERQTGQAANSKSYLPEAQKLTGRLNVILHTEQLNDADKKLALSLFFELKKALMTAKIVPVDQKPAITTTPKVTSQPTITTTPKVKEIPKVTTTPKAEPVKAVTTTPKVTSQPAVTTVPKVQQGIMVEKVSGLNYLDDQLGSMKNNVKVNKYESAESVNNWWKNQGYDQPPYTPKTVVQEITLLEDTKFVRVYNGVESGLYGGWVMRAEDVKGLTPLQIQEKFALPQLPEFIGEVTLPKGSTIRAGEVNPLFGSKGGGFQFDMIQQRIGEFKEIGKIIDWSGK